MPTLQNCVQLLFEEEPRAENDPLTAPKRLSTISRFMRVQSLGVGPNPAYLRRGDELGVTEGEPPQLIDGYAPAGNFTARAYVNDLIFWLTLSGYVPTFTAGDALVTDPRQTTVVGVNALNSTTVNVTDTSEFDTAGTFILAATTAVTYTGKTATTFTGCSAHPATVGGELVNGNVPTGATKVVFAKRNALTAKTAQALLAYVANGVFAKVQGLGVSQLSMNAAGQVSGSLAALVYANVADPNLTPTYDSIGIPPLRSGEILLSPWLAAAGEADDFNFTVTNGLIARRGLRQSYFPATMQLADEFVTVTGSRPAFTLADADVDALLSAQTFAAKVRWVSSRNIAATTYKYSMWLEMPACQYVGGGPDELRRARRHGGSWEWFAALDETAGYSERFTLVGNVAAVEAYA